MDSSGIPGQRKVTLDVPSPDIAATNLFAGGGEMGALMRDFDWSKTPLGPVSQWPQSLRTAVRLILTSRYAMFIWWGRELVNLYNDPYRAFLGIKHPAALGKSARDVWSEIWDQIGPRADAVLLRGESTFDESLLLLMERHGYLEETYFTFSYSPLPDDAGNIGGLFCAVTEATLQVIGERRLRLLREIAAAMSEGRTPIQVCRSASQCLSGVRRDLPFSLIYLLEPDGVTLTRACEDGISRAHPAAPALVKLDGDSGGPWPLRQVIESGEPVVVEDLPQRFSDLPTGEWKQPPSRAVLLPIAQQGQKRPAGVLVAGLNPHRHFGDEFRGFVSLLANQIAGAIGNAVAYETERRRAEELAELDRAKTRFFSNVSHEFRTPLTLMLGPLDEVLPEARDRLSSEALEHLVAARRNALRLLKLVNSLLDFSRIEAGRVQAVYRPTDLGALTTEIASIFRSAMEHAGLRYAVECEPLPGPVYVDRDMWEKVVLNLLSNAFKFTFEGEVRLTLKAVDDHVELAVRDTGVGIPDQERGRVFDRFHRIENVRSRSYEGTGIGLALVQELVRQHGGTVGVESELNRGSTFTVTIPRGHAHLPSDRIQFAQANVSRAPSAEAYVEEAQRWLPMESALVAGGTTSASLAVNGSAANEPRPGPEEASILVADDNADMREYLAHLLRSEYRVYAVSDGKQAVDAARRLRPSLVLADVMMPRLDGFSLLRAIRQDAELAGTPVILLSARAGEESRVEGLQAGADDYLVKPFTARELLARVATHVKMANLRRQVAERESHLRAEAEQQRRRLQELLAQAPAAVALLSGPEHRWTYVNEEYVRITGRSSAADFIGKTVTEALPELDSQVYPRLLDQVYRTGVAFSGREMKGVLNRGSGGQSEEAYFDFVYQPVRDAAGEVEGVLVHAVEVTDKVLARQAVEENEERLLLAQTAAHIGTWEWDPVRNTSRLSSELHHMFGTDPGDPEPVQTWMSRVHREDWETVQRLMLEGNRTGSMDFEYRYEHPALGTRWLYCKGRRFRRETRLFGIVQDITDRKVAEHRLQAALVASQRLAAIVESSDDAIVSKDLNGIVTSWNKRAERMFGYTAEEMIGRSIITIIPPELQQDERRILDTIARGDRIEHFETVRVTKSGERIEVSLTISPVKDEDGRIIGAAKIARDITQRNRAERALRTSERLASVGRLAATVAHEINNPLEAVTNLVYLAKESAVQEPVRMYLAAAEEELARVSLLTKQTLGFYRETKGAVPLRLGSLIAPLVSVFASRSRNKGVEIQPEMRQDPKIEAVPGQIRQLIANLISNSMDAVEAGGRIRVRVSAATERSGEGRSGVRITVADTGAGIAAEFRPRLFEPFFTTKKDVGTGLGLWVCKSIVEKHLGAIRVRTSTAPGRSGTVFSIFLPDTQMAAAPEERLRKAV